MFGKIVVSTEQLNQLKKDSAALEKALEYIKTHTTKEKFKEIEKEINHIRGV